MFKRLTAIIAMLLTCVASAQNSTKNQKDDSLLNQYISSKGKSIIIFDSSNIKQFWIDKSVIGREDSFDIVLRESKPTLYESIPLRIQLANVNETQDCTIEVIANTEDFDFLVQKDNRKTISTSATKESFIQYTVVSSKLHLEDTSKTSFNIVFRSPENKSLSIKKIVLSFSENADSSFFAHPGTFSFTENNLTTKSKISTGAIPSSLCVTGKQTRLLSSKKIIAADNLLSSSVTIKNIGDKDTRIYIGYQLYTQNMVQIDGRNYPFEKNHKVLNVLSIAEDRRTIVVDSYADWKKNCYLALNAKEDLSDLPNTSIGGRIIEISKIDDEKAKITLDSPVPASLKEKDKVRVHGQGGSYIYTSSSLLRSGEEKSFISEIKKDNNTFVYSAEAFPRGVYSVVPLILSYSVDANEENTILINNYDISF